MTDFTEISVRSAAPFPGVAQPLSQHGGIFDHLAAEHADAAVLMARIASTDDPGERRELFDALRIDLLAHAHAEEEMFYPQLERLDDAEGELLAVIAQCCEDHQEIESLVEELADMDTGDGQWAVRFETLKAAVEQHIAREENALFDMTERALDHAESKDILDDFVVIELRERNWL